MSAMPQSENSKRTTAKATQEVKKEIVLQIKVSFWVPFYLNSVVLFARVFNVEPDHDKCAQMVLKGIKLTHPRTKKAKGFIGRLKALFSLFERGRGRGKSLQPFR
ncbi:hypothetical protein ATY36_13750 [Vibrio cidicii]|uniref:hypothetical protein n=1 Tax=Vibrio cidicii TaxID=1763883 RepID=UPI0007801366|nr:hypothetical protein [Vibrio cidicii]KYN82246.1 hypothetical protein ATY36_13750 [Vibrio cidicii]